MIGGGHAEHACYFGGGFMFSLCFSILLSTLLASAPSETPPSVSTGRVPVPEPTEEALQYHRSGNVLWVIGQVVVLAVPAFVLFSGLSARMRDFARRIGRRWYFVVVIYVVLYLLVNFVLHFPLSYYAGFVRQHDYGMSNQTFARWFQLALLDLGVNIVIFALVLWFPYWFMRRSPRRWWLYTALASLPLMFFGMFVEPIWIAPLYNNFGPMHDKKLEAEILDLAAQAGIEGGRVFEVDMSADTKFSNAYVVGFGSSKRIVLYDTLLKNFKPDEIRAVMAHEMGHYALHHVVIGLAAGFGGVLVSLFLIYHLANAMVRRWSGRFGFTELSDIASLPLMILLFHVIELVGMPIGLAVSRHLEHEADRFSLELTHDNHAAAMAFSRLQTENLGLPRHGLLHTLWRDSHPSLGDRIDFANDYRPWEHGEPERYGDLFKRPPGGQ
jgi:Zn-dependent protease with chaperone function